MALPKPAVQHVAVAPENHTRGSDWYLLAIEKLVGVVQELSQAHDFDAVMKIVRDAARNLTDADGATFVLREGDNCYYAEENAIAPLWKGKRFPMHSCVSGWAMQNARAAVIEDIYQDARVPVDAYRPTFVKSMVMVPVRRDAPIGAIGNYWATPHKATREEVDLLQALADTASVAIQNVTLYTQLENKVRELQESNYELGRFAWVASHDLQEPLRTISTQMEMVDRKYANTLDDAGREFVQTAITGANRLQNLIQDILVHARVEKVAQFQPVQMEQVLAEVLDSLRACIEQHQATITHDALPTVSGEQPLLARLLQNMLCNAIKFHKPDVAPVIHVSAEQQGNAWSFSVKDNGIGIDPAYHQRVFGFFQRLHSKEEYPGSGIGLATCKKIVELHGGHMRVESELGVGSVFYFTIPVLEGSGKQGG